MSAALEIHDGNAAIDLLGAPYFASAAAHVGDDALGRERYAPRTLEIALNPRASGGSGLRDALRKLENVCAKAERRDADGVARVTLRRRITGAAVNSAEFRILRGEVALPPSLMDEPALSAASAAPGTVLRLLIEPFGRLAAVSPQPVTLANELDGANRNFLDFANIPGSAGAKLQLKIADAGDTWSGSGKIWVAKRSGERRTDTLFFQGESGAVNVGDNPMGDGLHVGSGSNAADSGASGGRAARLEWRTGGSYALSTDFTLVGHVRIAVSGANMPRGLFRVLARCRPSTRGIAHDKAKNMGFALGWRIGGRSKTPRESDAVHIPSGSNAPTWEIYDLGEILIDPPVPPGYSAPSFDLNIYGFHKGLRHFDAFQRNHSLRWEVDFAALMPVDEGAAIIDSVGADDSLLLDTMGDAPGVYVLDSSGAAREFADFAGAPFSIGPEDTRVYILRDDAGDPSAVQFQVSPKYVPLAAGT